MCQQLERFRYEWETQKNKGLPPDMNVLWLLAKEQEESSFRVREEIIWLLDGIVNGMSVTLAEAKEEEKRVRRECAKFADKIHELMQFMEDKKYVSDYGRLHEMLQEYAMELEGRILKFDSKLEGSNELAVN